MTPTVFILLLVALLMLLLGAVLWHASGTIPSVNNNPPAYVVRPYSNKYAVFGFSKEKGESRFPYWQGSKRSCRVYVRKFSKRDEKLRKMAEEKPIYFDADGRETT